MMAKYRRKPGVIDAVQFTGENYDECCHFLGVDCAVPVDVTIAIRIHTLRGVMDCMVGHWIIRGIRGGHYSCDPSVFAATYEPA